MKISRHQWDLWLGTDQTLESLNAILEQEDTPRLTPERVKEVLRKSAERIRNSPKKEASTEALQRSLGLRLR